MDARRQASTLLLNEPLLKNFHIAKLFKVNGGKAINSMDFYETGELLVTAGDDEAIHLYSAVEGLEQRALYSKKYGVDLVRFTHHPNTVLCASKNNWDESLRYLSLHDNRYLRYFKGHRDRVVSLAVAPTDDRFLSASLDETMRVWDLRSPQCTGVMRLSRQCRPALAYDPQGLIFAVASGNNTVKLLDAREFDRGAFATFQVPHTRVCEWSSLRFSPDGKYILLASTEAITFLLDAFTGQKLQTFTSYVNDSGLPIAATFTPDGEHVLCGSEDGSLHFWKRSTGAETAVYQGHGGPVLCAQFNPKHAMFASACTALALWLPADEAD